MSFPTLLIHTEDFEQISDEYIPFANKESNPDIIWINREDPALTIEVIRNIQQHLFTRPYQEDRKIIILLNADKAQLPAQNALLKSLEEPPEFVQFILSSKHPQTLLPTILSRTILIKKTQETKSTNQLSEIKDMQTTAKIHHAEKIAKSDNPIEYIYELLTQEKQEFDQNPTKDSIQRLKSIRKTAEMLQANTNVRLCLEWCFFQMN